MSPSELMSRLNMILYLAMICHGGSTSINRGKISGFVLGLIAFRSDAVSIISGGYTVTSMKRKLQLSVMQRFLYMSACAGR